MAYITARTFYDVLELNKSASRNDVKDAYKRIALKRHPDKNPNDNRAVARFQEVQEAYETLYDNSKRIDYDIKIDRNKSKRPRPALFTGTARSWATATPYDPTPAFKRPDWFWSGMPKPKRSDRSPRPTESEEDWKKPEDWSGLFQESKQDWYEDWQKREEQRDKNIAELRAQISEEKKRKVEAKIPITLAITLAAILRLGASIDKMEAENKAADVIIEDWIGMDEKEGEFFDEVYQRNVTLNTLRRTLESEMKNYRKLYKRLKKFVPEQGAEAEQIYWRLQKKTARDWAKGEQSEGCDDQELKAREEHRLQHEKKKMAKEGYNHQAEERTKANKEYRRQAEEKERASEEHRHLEVRHRQEAKRGTHDEEQIKKERSSSSEQIYTSQAISSSRPAAESDDSPKNQAYQGDKSDHNETDDEVILIQSQLNHAQHLEVKNEFWEIAEGSHVCCFCNNFSTVFECPKYEQCGLRACERCRTSPPRRGR